MQQNVIFNLRALATLIWTLVIMTKENQRNIDGGEVTLTLQGRPPTHVDRRVVNNDTWKEPRAFYFSYEIYVEILGDKYI